MQDDHQLLNYFWQTKWWQFQDWIILRQHIASMEEPQIFVPPWMEKAKMWHMKGLLQIYKSIEIWKLIIWKSTHL